MKLNLFVLLSVAGLGLLGLSACDVSLAGDVTPPPSYQAPTDIPQATAQIVFPVVPPDPTQGIALYNEKCAPCHGTSGMGNGPQASQLPLPVPPIGSADVARLARPINWFSIITQGKIERMMPPFKSLTDRQRWDLVAYLYTLSAPQQVIDTGKEIYQTRCQSCHGSSGAGDGERAASLAVRPPNWRDLTRLAQLSAKDLVAVVSNGSKQVMPSFSNQLDESQQWAVVEYIRTLSFAGSSAQITTAPTALPPVEKTTPAAAVTQSAASTPSSTTSAPGTKVSFTGQVTHSGGIPLPEGLKVVLQGYDGMTPGWEATAGVGPDGKYQFENVELVSGRVYVASLVYQNVEFTSSTVHAADLGSSPVVDLPISITESSTDASVLSAQRVHIFLDFSLPGRIQVAQLFVVINPTENAVIPVDANTPGLVFNLPEGAENLQFQDGILGVRFIQTPTGFGDLMEVLPKTMHQVLFGFDLPYENNKSTFKLPFTLPVDSVVVMVPADGVSVESPTLKSSGQRTVEGSVINLYNGSNYDRGSFLELSVSGRPSSPAQTADSTSSTNGLVIGLGIFGAALILTGVWLFRQKKNREVDVEADEEEMVEESEEALLDAIVALDDLYQAGKLPEQAYLARRAELKARLKDLKEA